MKKEGNGVQELSAQDGGEPTGGKLRPFFLSLNIMLRVSFSPGRDGAFRHCWISSFWALWEKGNRF